MNRTRRSLPAIPSQFGGDLVAWAMWLYYVEGETQEGTARRLGMSRASVVNYLHEARERGLVKITVSPDILAQGQLSQSLCEKFGLTEVMVLPKTDEDRSAPEILRKRTGLAGARLLRNMLSPGAVLGVAYGRTIRDLAQAMERDPIPDTTVLQVSGSMLDESQSSPEFCTSLIANRIGARSLNFHAPAVLSSRDMRDRLMQEPPIARYMERLRHCDVTVFGVGAIAEAAQLGDVNLADREIVAKYTARGARGILVGRFIDSTGAEIDGPLTDRQITMSLEDLKAAPQRLLVASGDSKGDAVSATLAGGYVTHLVIDFDTAVKLAQA